ncbi:META domain-containing protein [Dongia soli]|uniref:META domain-containing protein n=1 Tax=Dongia soli TaxID=600628 RepID=A0ABU5EHB4_9PROT|nr:META domain-containing protein [Dongia soli]MDY0885626.1 META domain-containing protein [Dongia soli]
MNRLLIPVLTASLIALGACAQPVGDSNRDATRIAASNPALTGGELKGTRWRLMSYGTYSAPQHVIDDLQNVAFLQFDAKEQRFGGSTGCNRFFGEYRQIGDAEISIGQMGSTRMACLGQLDQQERDVLDLLSHATAYGVAEDQLTIATADGRSLTFAAVGPDTQQRYHCDGGENLDTTYSPLTGQLVLRRGDGKATTLLPEPKADGASFTNDSYRFWSKGDGALFEDLTTASQQQCRREASEQ